MPLPRRLVCLSKLRLSLFPLFSCFFEQISFAFFLRDVLFLLLGYAISTRRFPGLLTANFFQLAFRHLRSGAVALGCLVFGIVF